MANPPNLSKPGPVTNHSNHTTTILDPSDPNTPYNEGVRNYMKSYLTNGLPAGPGMVNQLKKMGR